MNISILTIGDEILIGQITNTNAAWLSSKITELGLKIVAHSTVGDNKDSIISEITRLFEISDLIITTGGLGPTHDDITKDVLAEFFDDKLVYDNYTLSKLENLSKIRNRAFTTAIKKQALVPTKCIVMGNNAGSAPGMLFKHNVKYLISLPGVPEEMKDIIINQVIPFINKVRNDFNKNIVLYKTLKTFNIPESPLAELIGPPEEFLNGASLAFLPSADGVKLRIGAEATDFNAANVIISRIETLIRNKASKYIYGSGEQTIPIMLHNLLTERKLTVSVAESCTGGLLGGEFTELPGSSAYFAGGVISYSNLIKTEIINVKPETLEKFGAVSNETVVEMAENIRKMFNTDFGISVSGIAGPDGGTLEKPVGTIYICLSTKEKVISNKYVFAANRNLNRKRAVATALFMLYEYLLEN